MPQKPKPLDDSESMPHWFGKDLRNWRRVRRMSAAALGAKVHLSGDSIVKIEKADRSCNALLSSALDDALDAGGALSRLWRRVEEDADKQRADADKLSVGTSADGFGGQAAGMLVMDPPALSDRMSPVERRAFLAASGIAALSAGSQLADLIPPLGITALPNVVRPEDVDQIRAASASLARWDNLYGSGGIVRAASIGQLNWATGLLKIKCPPELESDLYTAVGRMATVMGASAFDAYEHDDARKLLKFATVCAETAQNWHLRAVSLNWRSRHEIWCGSPDAGLTHAESGLVRSDRLTPREQAMLHNARARAFAKMGSAQETMTAIGQSDEVFSQAKPGEDVLWMAYYDDAQHHGDTGHALYDIALLADRSSREAARRLQVAIDGHKDAYVRSRALSRTKLASLTMATGDPQEAVSIAHRALAEVGRLRSKRAADDVRDLLNIAAQHGKNSDVARLRERIATTVLV